LGFARNGDYNAYAGALRLVTWACWSARPSGQRCCETPHSRVEYTWRQGGATTSTYIQLQHEAQDKIDTESAARGSFGPVGALAWLAVGLPFGIGLFIALQKAAGLIGIW